MSRPTWGALAGLAMGVGLLLVISWLRARRPMPVAQRIAPFVGSVSGVPTSSGLEVSTASAWSTLWLLLAPMLDARRWLRRGVDATPAEKRLLRRLTWAVSGAAVGVVVAVAAGHGQATSTGVLVLGTVGGVSGWLASERHDAHLRRKRRERIERQLPGVAELLAFAVSAGESPLAALERVAETSPGELAEELHAVVADVRIGTPLDVALAALARRVGSVPLQRFVDGLVIALERGTPIADVLRAQAADCRADERRRLLELAGRKDVLMLVPVVFVILPTVVLVALFPGISSLRLVAA